MSSGRSGDSVRDLQEAYSHYKVYDRHYEEIGKVDDVFVEENDQPEYIGVKMGFLGLKSTIIPISLVRVNDRRKLIEVAESKEVIKNAPSFDDDEEISPEHEAQILNYYGLGRTSSDRDRSYGGYAGTSPTVDLDYGERDDSVGRRVENDERSHELSEHELSEDRPAPRREETARPAAREVRDEDEVRVQRTEEELRAGVRQREAGRVNVRKRVHTDHERLRVPKRREEVSVERVPVDESRPSGSEGAPAAAEESTEEEIRIPVVEEEIVVEKKPVVKEEIRIRKNLVEEEEVVQENVRKEEIEVEDETKKQGDSGRRRGFSQ